MRIQQVVAVGGVIASGKSTVAAAVASRLGARLLGADATRAELHESGRRDALLPGFSETLYSELLRRTEGLLARGESVVLDGTFRSRSQRAAARELARRHGACFRFIECRAGRELCRRRLAQRGEEAEVAGWLALFDHFVEHLWEPVDELPAAEHRILDTSRPLEEGLAALGEWLREPGRGA